MNTSQVMSGKGPLDRELFLKSVDALLAAHESKKDGKKRKPSLQTKEQRDWNAAVDAKRKAKKASKK
jgi:hypothetical protein